MELSDYEQKAIAKFGQSVLNGNWSNDGLVSLLKVITDDFLQLKRISHYSKDNEITTQGARKYRPVVRIDGFQFIVDN